MKKKDFVYKKKIFKIYFFNPIFTIAERQRIWIDIGPRKKRFEIYVASIGLHKLRREYLFRIK